jgi:hypothetical protein
LNHLPVQINRASSKLISLGEFLVAAFDPHRQINQRKECAQHGRNDDSLVDDRGRIHKFFVRRVDLQNESPARQRKGHQDEGDAAKHEDGDADLATRKQGGVVRVEVELGSAVLTRLSNIDVLSRVCAVAAKIAHQAETNSE